MADQLNKKKTTRKYSALILYLVAIVLINLVGITLFWRLDLTANNLYSLSAASKKVVSNLSEPLTINVFFSKNLPPPYNNIELYLHDLLEEYELHSNDNLSYRFYDVTAREGDISEETEENRKIAQGYGITPISIRKIEKDEVRVHRAFMGIALIHGDVVGKITAVTSTNDLEYRITSTIRGMTDKITALGNLTGMIQVTLVLSSSILEVAPAINLQGVETLEAGIWDVVDRLNKKTFNRLDFMVIDPSREQRTPGELRRFERFSLEWPEIKGADGDVVPAGKGLAAVGVSYGQKSVERNLLNRKIVRTSRGPAEQYSVAEMNQVETFIDENINNIIDINEELGYLASHGALPLLDLPPKYPPPPDWKKGEDLNRFNDLVSQSYTLKEIKLDEPVPDGIDTLIIAGVKEKFTDWQLFLIDQFLMKGKSLALFLDSFNEIKPPGGDRYQPSEYYPLDTGLEKLLAHYGLKVKKSFLLDENCFINRERIELPIYYAPIIKDENIHRSLDFMENIKRLLVVKVSPLEAVKENIEKNNLVLKPLFFSSEKSWEMTGRINLTPQTIRPPADDRQKESKPLAYLLEGEFPSYFAGKPIPVKSVKEGEKKGAGNHDNDQVKRPAVKVEKSILAKGKPGKIFLIGTGYILKDALLDERGQSSNAVFLLNLLDYLNNREDIAVMRSKNQRFNPLKDSGAFVKLLVKILNIVGLPALVILLGIITWFRRTARKKRIRAMFAKTRVNEAEKMSKAV
jgi:ABC-2 type transport system permease protein